MAKRKSKDPVCTPTALEQSAPLVTTPGPTSTQMVPVKQWEFGYGQFRFRGGPWHSLPRVHLELLHAFVQAKRNILSREDIIHLGGRKVTPERVDSRLTELRQYLHKLLDLPEGWNPLVRISVGHWQLKDPPATP